MNSNQTENKIRGAITKAAMMVAQDGEHPNSAMVKSASNYGLNPEMTCRAVEALNIALVRSHLKTAIDKTESHELADKDTVLKQAFVDAPVVPELPEETPDMWANGGSYSVETTTPKVASAEVGELVSPRDVNDLVRNARGYEESKIAEIAELELEVSKIWQKAENVISKTADYFRRSDKRDEFDAFATEAYAELGERGADAVVLIHKTADYGGDLPVYRETPVMPVVIHGEPIDGIRTLLACRNKAAELECERAVAVVEFTDQIGQLHEAINKIAGFEPPASQPVHNSAADMIKTGADGIIDAVKGSVDQTKKEIYPRMGVPDTASSLITKGDIPADYSAATSEKLRDDRGGGLTQSDIAEGDNMRRGAVLQDLILNDPILSQQDPEVVTQAYQTFLELSPDAALIPDVARGVLRNSIANQAVDPYTAKELVGLQSSIAPSEKEAS